MTRKLKVFIPIIAILFTVAGCSDSNDSPYEELLSHQPYANLTDSIHQSPSDADLYYRRGMLLYKNNNNPPALADLRKDYALAGLTEKELARDPFRQFEKWFQEAEAAKILEPNAMTLITATRDALEKVEVEKHEESANNPDYGTRDV